MPRKPSASPALASREYELLAAFRYALRSFLRFSESAAEEGGLTAQHYQAMLVVRGAPEQRSITIGDLAQQLFIRHHSAVGLVDRLHVKGLMTREASPVDRRKVCLRLTMNGARLMERLGGVHREELRRIGPELRRLVEQVMQATETPPPAPGTPRAGTPRRTGRSPSSSTARR